VGALGHPGDGEMTSAASPEAARAGPARLRPIPNLRWIVAGMLLLATTINYVDRQTISVAAPVISAELGFTATDYSWIVFAFLLSYAVMQAVAGGLVDRIGTRRGFSLAIVGWSLANMLHALGAGVGSFAALRGLLGLFEAANYPAALKAISEWFPRSERSTAVGLLNVGPGLGAILAPPVVAWRWSFVATGLIGFLWLALWLKLYHLPGSHPRLGDAEAAHIRRDRGEDAGSGAGRLRLGDLLVRTDVWGLMLARFSSDGAFYFFVFWLPKYLSDERGFDVAQIGLYAWIPFLAADLGSLAGGWLGTRLIRGGWSLDASRKAVIWAGALLVPFALPALGASSPYLALAYIAVAMFGIQLKCSSLFTLPADLVPARDVALTWGLSGGAGSLGGMAFTPLVGWLVDRSSYAPVFWIVSGMHVVSAAVVMLMIPRVGEPPAPASA
jgi:MFS transporter, ACS family, aldohexuronate transporter